MYSHICLEETMMPTVDCCCATVWKRDTYRRTGRGRSGFSMHYTQEQCSRAATHDGRCWQHRDKRLFWSESNYYHTVERKRAHQ